jgi:MYXO-CTERM domain-containing protein
MVRSLSAKRFQRFACLVFALVSLSIWVSEARGDCCLASFSPTTGMSTAAGGSDQACNNAVSRCCSLTAHDLQDSVDAEGNHTCTGICGSIIADMEPSLCGTDTPTATPTSTPTATPSETPTGTPVPQGGSCAASSLCSTGICVDGVCCDTACTGALEHCNLPGQAGTCASTAAEAPALTPSGLIAALALLVGAGAWSIRRLRL